MEIPPKTTSICQPLDCFFNRQWKYFIRRLFDRIQLDQVPINLLERNNIIKLNSSIYNQLSAIVFKKLIFVSWFIAGYTDKHPGDFLTVKDVCFDFDPHACNVSGCYNFSFINCAHCTQLLCVSHFFEEFHFHC